MSQPIYSVTAVAVKGYIGSAIVYTVPAGFTFSMRNVNAYNNSVLNAFLYVEGPPGQAIVFLENLLSGELHGQWDGMASYLEGESITLNAVGGAWDVTISGYLLTNP